MSDTSKREAPIEEAAKAMQSVRIGVESFLSPKLTTRLAEVALAVFEQAHTPTAHPAHSGHEYGGGYARAAALAAGDPDWMNATGDTPTDDELEAAAERYRQDTGWTMAEGHAVVEAFLAGAAAGFRRPVQGEPLPDYFAPKPMPQGWVWAEPQEVDADPDTAFELGRVAGYDEAMREIQGEPSDAQVLAALNAWYREQTLQAGANWGGGSQDLSDWSPQSLARARAALRAAFQEGENRG